MTAGTFHTVCFSKHLDTGKPCVTSQDTICQDTFTRPPSQDRLDGRVCPRTGLSQKEPHIICAQSLLGEIEDDTGGTVLRPITSKSTGRPRR